MLGKKRCCLNTGQLLTTQGNAWTCQPKKGTCKGQLGCSMGGAGAIAAGDKDVHRSPKRLPAAAAAVTVCSICIRFAGSPSPPRCVLTAPLKVHIPLLGPGERRSQNRSNSRCAEPCPGRQQPRCEARRWAAARRCRQAAARLPPLPWLPTAAAAALPLPSASLLLPQRER